MKKKSLYILLTFIIMLIFNVELNALTCTYQNPLDANGEDIILEFTNKSDKPAKEGDSNVNTCIDASKSKFMGISLDLHLWNPTPNNFGIYDKASYFTFNGVKWAFNSSDFKDGHCTKKVFGSGSNELTCPQLEYNLVIRSGADLINTIRIRHTVPDPNRIPLILKSGASQTIDNDGNVTEEKNTINTCNYDLDVSNMHGNGNRYNGKNYLEVIGWSNGTTTMKLDNFDVNLKMSDEYPLVAKTNKGNITYKMDQKNLSKIMIKGNDDEGYSLTCEKNGFVYYDKKQNAYIISFDKSEIPEDDDVESTMFGQHGDKNEEYGKLLSGMVSNTTGKCTDYLGTVDNPESLAYLLDIIYTIIKVVSILIVILWCMLDLAKVITKDKDDLIPTLKNCVIRIIILLIILLLPAFIDIIGNLFGKEDILCGIK